MRRHIPSSYSFHLGWRTQKRRYSFVYGLTSSSIHQIGRCTKCVICCIRSATVHISVNDVNEYAPKFNQPSYVVDVDEGRPADKIIQVEANDADCSAKYGDICRYDILNKDQPFAIDSEGLLPFPLPIDTLCPATLFPLSFSTLLLLQ